MALAWTVSASSEPPPERDRLFLGEAFEGLGLTRSEPATDSFSFVYGDCEPPPGEGGCAPPLEVQNWSICRRHPLEIDLIPRRILRMRGVPVIDYGDRLEVLTGRTDVVLFGDERRVRRAVAALRATRGPARLGRALSVPRWPRWVLRELELVRVARRAGPCVSGSASRCPRSACVSSWRPLSASPPREAWRWPPRGLGT